MTKRTQTEMYAMLDNNEAMFMTELQDWANGEHMLCKDNYDLLSTKFIETFEADELENEVDAFGSLQETPNAPDFHSKFYCLYELHSSKKFCPDTTQDNTCTGCEVQSREYMDFVERIYSKETCELVEASYHSFNFGRSKQENLSLCCLAPLHVTDACDYCTECREQLD